MGKPIENYMINGIGKPDKEWQDKKVWENVKGLERYEERYNDAGKLSSFLFNIEGNEGIGMSDEDGDGNIDGLRAHINEEQIQLP